MVCVYIDRLVRTNWKFSSLTIYFKVKSNITSIIWISILSLIKCQWWCQGQERVVKIKYNLILEHILICSRCQPIEMINKSLNFYLLFHILHGPNIFFSSSIFLLCLMSLMLMPRLQYFRKIKIKEIKMFCKWKYVIYCFFSG